MADPAPTPTPIAPRALFGASPADLAALLPPGARRRLEALRERADDMHRRVPHGAELIEATQERQRAQQRLDRLVGHPSQGGFGLGPSDAQVIAQRRQVQELTETATAISNRYETRGAAWQVVAATLREVEAWLRDGRPGGTAMLDDEREPPKLKNGEDVLAAVERLRRRVRELKADLHRLESAPHPSAFCKAQMRTQVEALAMQGAPSVAALVEHGREVTWPVISLRSQVFNTNTPALAIADGVVDTLGLFAWLHQDALIKRLAAEIDSEADDAVALSASERERQTAVAMADILEQERLEASLVRAAQDQGLPVEHRSDMHPLALLGLNLMTAPVVNGGTTPGFAFDLVHAKRR